MDIWKEGERQSGPLELSGESWGLSMGEPVEQTKLNYTRGNSSEEICMRNLIKTLCFKHIIQINRPLNWIFNLGGKETITLEGK